MILVLSASYRYSVACAEVLHAKDVPLIDVLVDRT